ncbi:hypothetical protein ACFZDK_31945 [Streptomyces sp. NPDC007901]|uniref:hypothetical protein n=1 Tax=Streptomyces sp. NPDC007901 TaxID=3364785 RepID=UPI0036E33B7C
MAATLAGFTTFATGYLARPVVTMPLMGVASFLIGVLPAYGRAGTPVPGRGGGRWAVGGGR